MEHWVSLEAPCAYGLSVHDDTIAAACADGLVRLFRAADLRYIATLPRPPPLGHANIASIKELQEITDAVEDAAPAIDMAAVAEQENEEKQEEKGEEDTEGNKEEEGKQEGTGKQIACSSPPEAVFSPSSSANVSPRPAGEAGAAAGAARVDARGGNAFRARSASPSSTARDHESGGGGGGGGRRSGVAGGGVAGDGVAGRGLRYPAAVGCRLSPTGTKVVCVYADRGLFIWDITDPLCVGKYRSFLAHAGCIWDVQRMPGDTM